MSKQRATHAVLIVVAVLAVIAVAIPAGTGFLVKPRLKTWFRSFSSRSPGVEWQMESFHQGLWSSTATSRVTLATAHGKQPITFELKHTIEHGPALRGLYLMRIKTRPVLAGRVDPALLRAFGDRAPISLTATLPLRGPLHLRFASPALTGAQDIGQGRTLTWKGMSLTARFGRPHSHLTLQGSLPLAQVRSDLGVARLSGVTVSGDSRKDDHGAWGSRTAVRMDELSAQTVNQQGQTTDGRPPVKIHDGRLDYNTSLDAQGLVQIASGLHIADIDVGDRSFNKLQIEAHARRLSPELLQLFTRRGAAAGMAALRGPGLARIVTRNPQIEIDPIHLDTPNGPVQGKLSVGLAANGVAPDKIKLQLWPQLLHAKASLHLPEALAVTLAQLVTQRQLAAYARQTQQKIDPKQVQAIANARLEGLVNAGFVSHEDGAYGTSAHFEHGHLTINGHKVF